MVFVVLTSVRILLCGNARDCRFDLLFQSSSTVSHSSTHRSIPKVSGEKVSILSYAAQDAFNNFIIVLVVAGEEPVIQ